jgi:hypothetical protein
MKKVILILTWMVLLGQTAFASQYQGRAINIAKVVEEGKVTKVTYTIQVFETTGTPTKVYQRDHNLNLGNVSTSEAVNRILNHIDLVTEEVYAQEEGAKTLSDAKATVEAYISPAVKSYIPVANRTQLNDPRP